MGIFYVDTSNDDSLEAKRKYQKEITDLANEMLEKAKDIPDDRYPDFLFQVQLNEFSGDDYRIRGTCTNPNVVKAYTIRRKYSSYWDYLDALSAYQDYVDYVDSAYGSFEMMKAAADEGYGSIFIPKKPKLTGKKKNKELLRTGFIPSRIDEEFEMSPELLDEIIGKVESTELVDIPYQEKGIDRRMDEKIFVKRERIDRVSSIFSSSMYAMSPEMRKQSDAIISFLNGGNSVDLEMRARGGKSFAEGLEELHKYDFIPEEFVDDMLAPTTAFIQGGMLVDSKKQRQIEILQALEEAGYDFFSSSATKGIDKEAIRAVMHRVGATKYDRGDLTPKQLKKLKKKEAKRRRKEALAMKGNERLNDILLKNRVNISRSDILNGGASFSINDIFD